MEVHFKRDMFITSFIPLWISILLINLWNIIEFGIAGWSIEMKMLYNLNKIFSEKYLDIIVLLIVLFTPLASATSISKFLKEQFMVTNKPHAKVVRAVKEDPDYFAVWDPERNLGAQRILCKI